MVLEIYPNPAKDLLKIEIGIELSPDSEIMLYNNIGNLVSHTNIEENMD